MTSHTPGPWTAKPFGVIVGGEAHQYTNGRAQSQIAMVVILQNSNAADVGIEREANASLIAAAPELLEALVAALPRLGHRASCISVRPASEWAENGSISAENCSCELRLVRAAIAKATGATP